jgi:hypothetical protein
MMQLIECQEISLGQSEIEKLAGRPNKNAFDYALRHFNHHGKNKTGKSQIQFYYKGDD